MPRVVGLLPLALLCALGLLGCSSSHPSDAVSSAPTTSTASPATSTAAPGSSQTETAPLATTTTATTTTATTTTATTTTTTATATATATTSTTSATAGSIPDTTFSEASNAAPGAGAYPPGISGERCTSTFLGYQGQVTSDSQAAAYAILTDGPSCAEAGRLGAAYMQATSGAAASASAPPTTTTVDGERCGSYWYRPAGDGDEPLPFVTCQGAAGTFTVFGSGD